MKRSELVRVGFARKPAAEPKRRQRKCKICRTLFEPRSMTHSCCGLDCAEEFGKQETIRKAKRERQAGLEKFKKRGAYVMQAQTAFNAFIRYRDRSQPCICCGSLNATDGVGGGWDAGHWISRGHASHLRFDERNVHRQRKGCNRPGGTTRAKFRVGLVARIGEEAVQALEALEYAPATKMWSIEECKQITATYRAKLRKLKEDGQ